MKIVKWFPEGNQIPDNARWLCREVRAVPTGTRMTSADGTTSYDEEKDVWGDIYEISYGEKDDSRCA